MYQIQQWGRVVFSLSVAILLIGCSGSSSPKTAASGAAAGPVTGTTNALVRAHHGAYIESVDNKDVPAPKLLEAGNEITLEPGVHQFAIRAESDASGNDALITVGPKSMGKLYQFPLDLKSGHIYDLMSAGKSSERLEILDKTEDTLQYFDWGSRKFIAENSEDEVRKNYVTPQIDPAQSVTVEGTGGMSIITIDGDHVPGSNVQMDGYGGNSVVMTPGYHRITARRVLGMSNNDVGFSQEFIAGHRYEVGPEGTFSRGIALEDLTQAKSDEDDEDDEDEEANLQPLTQITKATARLHGRDAKVNVEASADVKLVKMGGVPFTLKATLVAADGNPVQAAEQPISAARVIRTGDAEDEDTYRLSLPYGAPARATSGLQVQFDLLDASGQVRSTQRASVQMVNQ